MLTFVILVTQLTLLAPNGFSMEMNLSYPEKTAHVEGKKGLKGFSKATVPNLP